MNEIETTDSGLSPEELEMFFGTPEPENMSRSLGHIKVMRETGQFQLPSGELVDSICGHVLYSHKANAYWINSSDESDTAPPDCSSVDGIKPMNMPGKQRDTCLACPKNKFESAEEGKGKACKNTIRMLILIDNEYVPVVLAAPPTSISTKGSLMKWMDVTANQVGKAYTEYNPKIRTPQGAPITDRLYAHVKLHLNKEKYGGKVVSVIQAETIDVLLPNAEGIGRVRYINSIRDDAKSAYIEEISRFNQPEAIHVDANTVVPEKDIPF